jgi:hypothetical protein
MRFDPGAKLPYIAAGDHEVRYGDILIRIPDNFRSDLASVGKWLLWLFSPAGRHQPAAFVHDFLYRTKKYSRAVSDAIFLAMLNYDGVGKPKRIAMYLAVRAFGWISWRTP